MQLPVLDAELLAKVGLLGGGGTLGARWLAHVWRQFGKVENLQAGEARLREQLSALLDKCNKAREEQDDRHQATIARIRAEYEATIAGKDDRIKGLMESLQSAHVAEATVRGERDEARRALGWDPDDTLPPGLR